MEEQQNKDADNGSASEVIDKTKVDGGNLSEPSPTFPVNPEPYSDVAPHRLPVTEDSAFGQPNAQRNAQVDIASLESEKEKDEEKGSSRRMFNSRRLLSRWMAQEGKTSPRVDANE